MGLPNFLPCFRKMFLETAGMARPFVGQGNGAEMGSPPAPKRGPVPPPFSEN